MKYELILGLVLLWGIIHYGEANRPTKEYDYLKLVATWPNSYCLTHDGKCKIDPIPQYFIITHLQAFLLPYTVLQNCSTKDDVKQIGDAELRKYWPNLTAENDLLLSEMWKQEWRMYGSCSAATMNLQDYFHCAVNHIKAHDLKRLLKYSGIVPGASAYPFRRILHSLKRLLGVSVDIVCEKEVNGKVFLSEIHLCIDYYGKTRIGCFNKAIGCNDDVIYPDKHFHIDDDSH